MGNLQLILLGFLLVLGAAGISYFIADFLKEIGAPLPPNYMKVFYLALGFNLIGYILYVVIILAFMPSLPS